MPQSPILDSNSAPPVAGRARSDVPPATSHSPAAGFARLGPTPATLEPGTLQSGFSAAETLAEMASRDVDAALQLLAERAQYITDATGAAIALRRGQHNDMFCRASAGSSAPVLGALLSMEYGLSGESVRTREIQRCDDAQKDTRVNNEGCRLLGIASVIVLPIVSDDRVQGVFELFSGKPYAFDERDLSALQRLGAMVELTLKFAIAEQPLLPLADLSAKSPIGEPITATEMELVSEPPSQEGPAFASVALLRTAHSATTIQKMPPPMESAPQELPAAIPSPTLQPAPIKPLFWSATPPARPAPPVESASTVAIPPVMRTLQKCQACGFPISRSRRLCIECEEKEWRGQTLKLM